MKMKASTSYIHNVSAQAIGRFFTGLISIIVFILIGRLMGPGELGQFSYILTFFGFLFIFSEVGTPSVFAKDISQIKEAKDIYLANYLVLRIGLALLFIIPGIIAAYFLRKDLFFILSIGVVFLPLFNLRFFEPLYQVYNKPLFSAYTAFFYGAIYFTLSLIAVIFFKNISSISLSYIVANILYALFALYLSTRILKPKFTIRTSIIKNIMKLALPMGVGALFATVNSHIDIFMLASMKSDYEVGIYSAAYRFLDMTAMLAVTILNPIIPIFSKWALENRQLLKERYTQLIETFSVATLPVALAIPFITPLIVRSIYGQDFLPSADVLNILAWVGVLLFLSLLTMSLCLSIGVVHFGWWITALAAGVNIFLNYIWIPKYSYIGSAWATVICELLILGVVSFFVIKHIGNFIRFLIWIKIIFANIIFCLLLHFIKNVYLGLILGTTIYVLMVVSLKVIPSHFLSLIKNLLKK
ncbi:MAG: flippase [Candidatus Aureabacteria bacterium]|nr:flippase [Candidatus Auribacterota bacterium]